MMRRAGMRDDLSVEVRESEEEVLKTLSTALDGDMSFTGMRRVLGIHQEKLSRILKRLEKYGLVDKTERGYRLSGKARRLMSEKKQEPSHALVNTVVDDVGLVLAGVVALRGRWVEDMRWLGYSVEDGAHTLRWISQDGAVRITLRFKNGRLRVDSNVSNRKAARAAIAILRKAYELALADTTETPMKAMTATLFNIAA
ncbi:MAG: hypothetical protein QXZ62_08045 [Candidatus Caldarchaeum sp.]